MFNPTTLLTTFIDPKNEKMTLQICSQQTTLDGIENSTYTVSVVMWDADEPVFIEVEKCSCLTVMVQVRNNLIEDAKKQGWHLFQQDVLA